MKVGLPTMNLNNNPSSKTVKTKHSGNMKKVVLEAFEERYSKSLTLDRSKSHLNIYTYNVEGVNSAKELIDFFEDEFMKTYLKNPRYTKQGDIKKPRVDASRAFTLIQKPKGSDIAEWTREQYLEFSRNGIEVINEILKDDGFDFEIDAVSTQFDEGFPHDHIFGRPVKNGVYSANHINSLKFFTKLNIEYVSKMNERGFEVDRIALTEEERKQKKAEKKEHGLNTNAYIKHAMRKERQEHENKLVMVKNDIKQEKETFDNYLNDDGILGLKSRKKKKELYDKEKALDARESDLNDKEKALDARESDLDDYLNRKQQTISTDIKDGIEERLDGEREKLEKSIEERIEEKYKNKFFKQVSNYKEKCDSLVNDTVIKMLSKVEANEKVWIKSTKGYNEYNKRNLIRKTISKNVKDYKTKLDDIEQEL